MINNKEKIQAQIEKLEVELKTLKEEVNKEEETLIDFSKFIGRNGNILVIKGDKHLRSYTDGDIFYSNDYCKELFNNSITYTKTTLGELNQGDVYICVDDVDNMRLRYFNILRGKNEYGNNVDQYLDNIYGIETVKSSLVYSNKETEVYKFNRY